MGRPKKYESVEEMQSDIDKFFQECKDEQIPPTIQGLALALGFTSRQSLLNYEGYNEGEFLDAIKTARLKVENAKVIGGMTGKLNPAIVIFDLKNNHDHKDKQEVDNNHSGGVRLIIEDAEGCDPIDYETKVR